ncbi:MAG: peptidoglycan DD-metalloendopeptidase family protein [Myxococcota bacterium]
MRGLRALTAGILLAVASISSAPARANDASLPILLASIESAPRSELTTRYDDLSDLLAPEPDRSLDPVLASAATDSTLTIATGRVPKRGTLAGALRGAGVDPVLVDQVARGLRPVFDFRRARSGDFYALIRDDSGALLSFEYQRGRGEIYRLDRDPNGGLVAKKELAPLDRRVLQLGGVVKGSLFTSLTELGERPELVHAFTDIFLWDFDFSTQTHPGDEFRLVFEKYFDKDGFVRYGRVLAAEYRSSKKNFVAVWFEDEQGHGDYFTPDGNSVRRAFLKAPVKFSRISSRYTKSRLHPILRTRRPHEGIDYAAPIGTPVWSIANGKVIYAGWSGGFGRLIKVKHTNGYISYYGHLSRYAKGLRVGQSVSQKQLIGYVGKTGLATGPHLDFRIQKNGRFFDPLTVKLDMGEPIAARARSRFNQVMEMRLSELRAAQPEVALEAAM